MRFYALGELEALCKKACVGAGFRWGEAEEAAKAVSFLCVYDLPAIEALVSLLPLHANRPRPCIEGESITNTQTLCPIITGIALADRAYAMTDKAWHISAMEFPLLSLPLLWRAGEFYNKIFHLQADNWEAHVGKDSFAISGDNNIAKIDSAKITCVKESPPSLPMKKFDSIAVDESLEKILLQFFMQTTVPESEESRLQGAGAGLNDND